MSSQFPRLCLLACAVQALLIAPAAAREIRFCVDPNNLPFSNERGEGFEDKIATLVASDIGAIAKFVWAPQWRGFIRKGLGAGMCDVVPGVPANFERVRATKPYYIASYAFVQPSGDHTISSFDDKRLQTKRIGVQLVGNDGANTPPMNELAKRGIIKSIHGYMVYGDWSKPDPLLPIVAGVAKRDVDVAVVWGPVADYYAAQQTPPLRVTHLEGVPWMSFAIAMGVRKSDVALAEEINRSLERRREYIRKILADYHIQSLVDVDDDRTGGEKP